MNNSVYKTEWYENALLRVVRIILLFTMTISILVTVGFGFYGVYKFLKPISETVPIKILPPESVNLQKFIDEIDPAKKLNDRPIQADVNTCLYTI